MHAERDERRERDRQTETERERDRQRERERESDERRQATPGEARWWAGAEQTDSWLIV